VEDLKAFYASRDDLGVMFTEPPHELHGSLLASFLDSEGVECSVSG